jgi:tetratricopeptide (TPR) repeat protein
MRKHIVIIGLLWLAFVLSADGYAAQNDSAKMSSSANLSDLVIQLTKGQELFLSGEYDAALQAYEGALQLDSENISALNGKARALDTMGEYEKALIFLNKSLALSPFNAFALREKGWALNRMGRYQEALRCINQSILIEPMSAVAWEERGRALIDSQISDAWTVKGYALESMGLGAEADVAYARASAARGEISKAQEAGEDVIGSRMRI